MKPPFKVTQDLLTKWRKESIRNMMGETYIDYDIVAQLAANWGADQELDACCKLIEEHYSLDGDRIYYLRRPKSKKLEVFEALERLYDGVDRKQNKMLILEILGKIDEKYFEN